MTGKGVLPSGEINSRHSCDKADKKFLEYSFYGSERALPEGRDWTSNLSVPLSPFLQNSLCSFLAILFLLIVGPAQTKLVFLHMADGLTDPGSWSP